MVFANRYFLAIHLCRMRRIRPISVMKAKKRFRELFLAERKATPSMLYRRQFEECYGMDARPVSCIGGDFRRHTDGLAIPGQIFDGDEEEDEEEAETFIEKDGAELDEEERNDSSKGFVLAKQKPVSPIKRSRVRLSIFFNFAYHFRYMANYICEYAGLL